MDTYCINEICKTDPVPNMKYLEPSFLPSILFWNFNHRIIQLVHNGPILAFPDSLHLIMRFKFPPIYRPILKPSDKSYSRDVLLRHM